MSFASDLKELYPAGCEKPCDKPKPPCADPCEKPKPPCAEPCSTGYGNWGYSIAAGIIVAIIVGFILYFAKPNWILKGYECDKNECDSGVRGKCCVNWAKLVGISILIGILALIIVWFLCRCRK
ncbi:Transmembrane domain-containing protein [Orpheovirus IHUMI-LCC2]|uniref:Transmembrane domain-containing protein n=1 Tax=Orpheovirus IHUMI-LCC2 TaxID=2023057 RepID=A0A2I2L5V5_9VIRU|nr:Transmembrane domain-containing protein [Orpheovirus IHUMI-LCC2]SNW62935.1 Transmembrane domain-containing protein [Orpheovirus IHUMI-LCC2]